MIHPCAAPFAKGLSVWLCGSRRYYRRKPFAPPRANACARSVVSEDRGGCMLDHRGLVGGVIATLLTLSAWPLSAAPPPTQDVFRRFSDRVVQIRIVDRRANSKTA